MVAVVVLIHAGVSAVWLGSMAYSLFNVQPKLGRMVGEDPARVEEAQRVLAHGNRWRVVGLIAALWVSGLLLVALRAPESGLGWAVVGVKVALLAAATGLFWWVSWRGWPSRVFALPDELPALQGRFRSVAIAMLVLVGASYALGVTGGYVTGGH